MRIIRCELFKFCDVLVKIGIISLFPYQRLLMSSELINGGCARLDVLLSCEILLVLHCNQEDQVQMDEKLN